MELKNLDMSSYYTYIPTRGKVSTFGSDSSINRSLRVWSIVRYLQLKQLIIFSPSVNMKNIEKVMNHHTSQLIPNTKKSLQSSKYA